MMDNFVRSLAALASELLEDNKKSIIFGKTPALPRILSFIGEIASFEMGYSNSPAIMDKCAKEKMYSEANFTNPVSSYDLRNMGGSVKHLQGLVEVCSVPKMSILLNFKGTFYEHLQTCRVLHGALRHYYSPLPSFWKNSNSQCGPSDGPVMWVHTPWASDSKSLATNCITQGKNGTFEYDKLSCQMELRCSICVTYQNISIFLFGPIEFFDRTFKLQLDTPGNLMFSGSNSEMVKENGVWMLKSLVSANVLVNNETSPPIGRSNWTVMNCPECAEKLVTLTFSLCLQDEFSCDNGQCVASKRARCNGVVQCDDTSDEFDCVFILKDQGYQKNQMPSKKEIQNGTPIELLRIAYAISMKFVSEIFTSDGFLALDFEMSVQWIDDRITVKNLHANHIVDADIWKPQFMYFATLSEGDAISDASEKNTLSATTIENKHSTPTFDDAYMGIIK